MRLERLLFNTPIISLRRSLSTAILIISFLSCGPQKKQKTNETLLEQLPDGANVEVDVQYAQNFSVSYHKNYKLVNLHFKSEGRAMDFRQKLVLVQRGEQVPENIDSLKDAWFIEVPVTTVAANHDGEIIRIKSLGLIDHIAGMGGGDIYDAELRKRWEDKKIASIGYSFHSVPNPELLMSANAELLILHTYDNEGLDGMKKLRELGINAIPHFAWAEEHFLGKAEWVKFTSLFFNKEEEANDLFEEIEASCNTLISEVASLPEKATTFLLYFPSNESDWKAHRNDYYASYLDAVSQNVLKDDGPTHSVGMTNEKLLEMAQDADYWIINSTEDASWPPSSFLKSFKSYREGNVYHYQKRTNYEHNAYDWYETPIVRPDLVLKDLVSIFYPEMLPDHELMFLDKVKLTKQ